MKKFFFQAAILPIIILGFASVISSPNTESATTIRTPKSLTAKDKAVIIEMFGNMIIEDEYRMEFDNKEVYGKIELPDSYINSLRTGNLSDNLPSTLIYQTLQPKAGFWYYINRPKTLELEKLLGKDNAARFQAIIKKYSGGK